MKSLIIDHKSVLCIVVHDYAWSACLVFYKRQMYQINVRLEIANMGKLIVFATPRNILVSGRHLHDFLSQIKKEYNYACVVKSLNTIVCV